MVAPISSIKWDVSTQGNAVTMSVEISSRLHHVVVPCTDAGRAAARQVLRAWMELAVLSTWPEEDPVPF